MREYLIVIAATLFLAWLIPNTHFGGVRTFETRSKNWICWFLIFAILSFFIGLRRAYNDTYVYIVSYRSAEVLQEFLLDFQFLFSDHPGFYLAMSGLKTLGVSEQGFLLAFSMVFILCVMIFFRKYSTSLFLSLFLLFTTNSYTFAAAAIKQVVAISLVLIAVTFALKGKWLIYVLFIGIASTMHPYALMFGLVPVLLFKPWTWMTYLILAAAVVSGFMLDSLLGTIVDITTMMGDAYDAENLVGEGINILRVLVANASVVLTFIYRKTLFQNSTKSENLMVNLTMLNGAAMFVGLFGNSLYFSRLANYFTIFQCVSLPWILRRIPENRRKFFTSAMIAGYAGFFIYANVISQPFDANFSRITLWQYLSEYVFGG